jgi:hypothetical protein
MPRQRSNIRESEEIAKAINEKPTYRCPMCRKLNLNIQNELYNPITLYVHIRLHKLDDITEELVKAITGKEVDF